MTESEARERARALWLALKPILEYAEAHDMLTQALLDAEMKGREEAWEEGAMTGGGWVYESRKKHGFPIPPNPYRTKGTP